MEPLVPAADITHGPYGLRAGLRCLMYAFRQSFTRFRTPSSSPLHAVLNLSVARLRFDECRRAIFHFYQWVLNPCDIRGVRYTFPVLLEHAVYVSRTRASRRMFLPRVRSLQAYPSASFCRAINTPLLSLAILVMSSRFPIPSHPATWNNFTPISSEASVRPSRNKSIEAKLCEQDAPVEVSSAAISTASGASSSVDTGTDWMLGRTEASDEMSVKLFQVLGCDGIGRRDDATSIAEERSGVLMARQQEAEVYACGDLTRGRNIRLDVRVLDTYTAWPRSTDESTAHTNATWVPYPLIG